MEGDFICTAALRKMYWNNSYSKCRGKLLILVLTWSWAPNIEFWIAKRAHCKLLTQIVYYNIIRGLEL